LVWCFDNRHSGLFKKRLFSYHGSHGSALCS